MSISQTDALTTQIKDIILGLSSSLSRSIPTNTFQSGEILGGGITHDTESRGRNTFQFGFDKAEVTVFPIQMRDTDRINLNWTEAILDIDVSLEVSWKAAPNLDENERKAITQKIDSQAFYIIRALTSPHAFSSATGLASGLLDGATRQAARYDAANGVIVIPFSFTGIMSIPWT